MENTMGRIPPHSQDAEESALGAMLLDKEAITTAMEILRGDDFYKPANKEIYETILVLNNRNEPVDLITLSEELKRRNTLEKAGGVVYLAHLSSSVGTIANTKYYCDIIKEKSTLRKLIKSSDEVMGLAYGNSEGVGYIIEKAEKNILEITEGIHHRGLSPIDEVLQLSFAQIEERAASKGGLTGISTGFSDLDQKLSGLQKSDLVLLAARPSMGKTSLGINIATNAALKAKARVAVFSLEMSKEQLVQRIISSTAHIDLRKIISGDLAEDEWIKIVNAMPILSKMDIFIDDSAGTTLTEMKAKLRRLKIEKGLDLVVIDYLQLMNADSRSENRQQEISVISRGLKGIAKEMECPVLALSQLSRGPDMRSDHTPQLSDLRESGAIEQDADIVMFLYRESYYDKDSENPNGTELIIAKHRNGPTGVVDLLFKGEYTKFLSVERNYLEEP